MSASRLAVRPSRTCCGHDDLARAGQAHQAGSEIDAAAQHVVGADDDVAHLHAGAQHDLAVDGADRIGAMAFLLDGECSRHGGAHVVEVEQHAVAQALDEAAIVAGHDALLHMLDKLQPMGNDAHFILFDEAYRSDDVDKQDRALGPRDMMF